ncbi:Integrin alpha-L, partial [Ophiophagus hannah]
MYEEKEVRYSVESEKRLQRAIFDYFSEFQSKEQITRAICVDSSYAQACGPTWERRCGQLDYLNGMCYIMNGFDGNVKEIQPAFQECVFGVDAVILYDDSSSIEDSDLQTMKNFFLNLMDSVAGADVQTFQRTNLHSVCYCARAQDELRRIASSNENVFPVESFGALKQLQKQLKDKIFNIEGVSKPSPDASASSFFEKEFSQGGFSSLLTPEHAVTGVVGAYSWTGGLEESSFGEPPQIRFLNSSISESYIGYSVALARFHQRTFYITGAPRFQHVGQVLVFESKSGRLTGNIKGQQVGSYFGAELASVDLNEDGNTDLLVIGAPHYYNGHQGGVVYVSSINSMVSRFGAALSTLGDISGDGLTDVVIGAPMEDENRGAIYIFLGETDRLEEMHSQRILATSVSPGLQFFGQSIQGRSRPVFTVLTSLRISPDSIPLDDPECGSRKISRIDSRGQVSLCFTLTLLSTKWSSGSLRAIINFSLQVDVKQTLPRLMLENETPSFSDALRLGVMPICINKTLWAQVPFQKDCGQDGICVPDLSVSFNFSGSKGLKLSPNFILNLTVKLENLGELAYEPAISFYYSSVLSFQGASVLESNWPLFPACQMHGFPGNASVRHSSCHFRPPALKTGTWVRHGKSSQRTEAKDSCENETVPCSFLKAFLRVSFRSSKGDTWPDKFVYFTIRAHSLNESNVKENNEATGQLPVLHPVNIIVRNLDSNATAVNVTFELPLKTKQGFFWNIMLSYSDVLKSEIFHVGSEASIRVDETRFFLNEPEHFSQITTEIELISPFNPVPIIIGSTIGGIVLLAIIVVVLYKKLSMGTNSKSVSDTESTKRIKGKKSLFTFC